MKSGQQVYSDLAEYVANIEDNLTAGNATEHTHRPALKSLIESLSRNIVATNEPKRVRCGAPDLIVTRGSTPLGHVETKDVGEDLRKVERSEQLARYLRGLSNLVLTNYLEFRWYVRGELRLTATLGTWNGSSLSVEGSGLQQVRGLLQAFLQQEVPTVTNPTELAKRMAGIASLMRDIIRAALEAEDISGALHGEMESFRKVLLPDLDPAKFADMYAQTICYGLFTARMSHTTTKPFSREGAAYDLPKTNPFLRAVFGHIAGPDLDERIAWLVEDFVELLRHTEIGEILKDFGRHIHGEDRVIPFYETFLAAYDRKLRETRGVYYTPQAVVTYIVHSVDKLLRSALGVKRGLADSTRIRIKEGQLSREVHKVLILDPALGTGTFLYEVINQILENVRNPGARSSYIREHLLPRMFGFEFLMAPYAVAHMKLGLRLRDAGYDFQGNDRLRVYLTNTLEQVFEHAGLPLFARDLVEEAKAAADIKETAPVMVVLGNPPYSGHSQNHGDWIRKQIETYKEGCPELRKPAQAKWLSDDYVKFIRFAQWRIEKTGYGILAFVTNHAYLDNPTFRGMRRSLMQSFDDIYILDLHGSSKKQGQAPGLEKDENVFDIQQGVAIGVFVKREVGKRALANVRFAERWGTREDKYAWLWDHDIEDTKWRTLRPSEPQYFFVPKSGAGRSEYESGWSVPEIFAKNGDPAPGIVTTHDDFAISWTREAAEEKVNKFIGTRTEEEARKLFKLCSQDQWQYVRAKRELTVEDWRSQIVPVLYRPFDLRWTVFNRNVAVHRRERMTKHLLAGENIALCTNRQVNGEFRHVFCAKVIATDSTVSTATKERTYLLPLYLYASDELPGLHENVRTSSLSDRFVAALEARLGMRFVQDGVGDRRKTFGPEDVFAYIYAMLHSPEYRERYGEFLQSSFPRIPLTSRVALFRTLCDLGEQLIAQHLLEGSGPPTTEFPAAGSDRVDAIRYTKPGEGANKGRVWINDVQYFEGVRPEVWEFGVGGFQVCEKWLKDRRGLTLSWDDVQHYEAILSAVEQTKQIIPKIDVAIDEAGGWPVN